MKRLLWIGDAACPSGFARSTHEILETVRHYYDVTVLGMNYRGDPHNYPYPIYPAAPGGDPWGLGRLAWTIQRCKPDIIVFQNDTWNIPYYMKALEKAEINCDNITLVGFLAVDGLSVRGADLQGLDLAIFWTAFAEREAKKGGCEVPTAVVGLGVDTDIFRPMRKETARERMELPPVLSKGFIVGNVNRNQARKRMDLSVMYFAEWVNDYKVEDAFLLLHIAPTGDAGFDCMQIAKYYGIGNRLIQIEPPIWHGVSEKFLVAEYNSFDVALTTTQGEGWGLTVMEAMACAVPVIVPDWSALGEWPGDSVVKIPCTSMAGAPYGTSAIGGVPDKELTVLALDKLYRNFDFRSHYAQAGLEHISKDEFRWETVGEAFVATVTAGVLANA